MPVYNEEDAIEQVLKEWFAALDRIGIDYELRAYNDGSKDHTAGKLDALTSVYPRLVVVNKPNEGHGPTILRGYRECTADWVFQTDSDGESSPLNFNELWTNRDRFDFLVGCREGINPPLPRRIIKWVSRRAVSVFFGRGITDVNSPYRLMRRSSLSSLLPLVPKSAFAPNVILSGLATRHRLRIYECPVTFTSRKTGTVSIVKWKLWKSAARAFVETLRIALAKKDDLGPGN